MIYDIRTKSAACDTLLNMTGYSETFWELKIIREGIDRFQTIPDDFSESEIGKYPFGNNPEKYKDMTLKISHFTTSDDNCESIGKYGLLDLGSTYQCKESDLRRFLDDHHIYIDLNSKKLIYSTTEYDITYNSDFQTHDEETVENLCNEVGRLFYLDNDEKLWGRKIAYGIECKEPSILRGESDKAFAIIMLYNNVRMVCQIINQLLDYGITGFDQVENICVYD